MAAPVPTDDRLGALRRNATAVILRREMRFWWVNQNQTFPQEFSGGYLWSPKRNKNGARNQFYENIREVAPGDVIFSFRQQRITAIGVARSFCYDCPKPTEFGTIGENWKRDGPGWR